MTDLARPPADRIPATLAAWLGTKAVKTQGEYLKCLRHFANFVRAKSAAQAVTELVGVTRGEATQLLEGWKALMLQEDLAAATINQRLAAVRSFVAAAHRHGVVDWMVEVDDVPREPRRDPSGPDWPTYKAILKAQTSNRDIAILRLMGNRGLRLSEVAGLLMEDFDGESVAVKRKGKREKERMHLDDVTASAIEWYLRERGREDGSLFGLKACSIRDMVERAGLRAGVPGLHAHALRHTAITRALDRANGDVRKVRGFSGHASVEMVMRYDDKRRSHATEVANMIEGDE